MATRRCSTPVSSPPRGENTTKSPAYGTLMAWAKVLGLKDALSLLKANEEEEKAADEKLSALAERSERAAAAGQEDAEAMVGRRR